MIQFGWFWYHSNCLTEMNLMVLKSSKLNHRIQRYKVFSVIKSISVDCIFRDSAIQSGWFRYHSNRLSETIRMLPKLSKSNHRVPRYMVHGKKLIFCAYHTFKQPSLLIKSCSNSVKNFILYIISVMNILLTNFVQFT